MDKHIARLYKNAPRFDESEIIQGEEYSETMREQEQIRDLLIATFGEEVVSLLNDYTTTLYDEMELEAQHFFQEGYRAAQAEVQ